MEPTHSYQYYLMLGFVAALALIFSDTLVDMLEVASKALRRRIAAHTHRVHLAAIRRQHQEDKHLTDVVSSYPVLSNKRKP